MAPPTDIKEFAKEIIGGKNVNYDDIMKGFRDRVKKMIEKQTKQLDPTSKLDKIKKLTGDDQSDKKDKEDESEVDKEDSDDDNIVKDIMELAEQVEELKDDILTDVLDQDMQKAQEDMAKTITQVMAKVTEMSTKYSMGGVFELDADVLDDVGVSDSLYV